MHWFLLISYYFCGANHGVWTTNQASKSSTFGRVNRTIGSTALRSLFLTKSTKKSSCFTAVAQCVNKYKITHSPLRSKTAFHCFAETQQGQVSSGGNMSFSSVEWSQFIRAFLLQSPRSRLLKLQRLQICCRLHRLSSSYHNITCGLPLQFIKTTSLSLKCRLLALSVKTEDGLHQATRSHPQFQKCVVNNIQNLSEKKLLMWAHTLLLEWKVSKGNCRSDSYNNWHHIVSQIFFSSS